MRTGTVSLPLHPGKCPAWLFQRMKPLAGEISRLIIDSYGTTELLRRIADPMFFHALGCVIGFDWHSSGVTTTTCGALKEAITSDTGVVVCGGKGKSSRKTPGEIDVNAGKFGLDCERLKKASYLSAKVDSSCIQAGYELYHHCFFFDEKGNWCVVQQGMNDRNSYARRYHWFDTDNFTDNPPDKIAGTAEPSVLNLVSGETGDARKVSVDLINDNPIHLRRYFTGQTTLSDDSYSMPMRHEILPCDLTEKDWRLLHNVYELQPQNYEELICLKGIGAKKLRALALVARLIHGTKLDWKDPVKYSFAHGGKDGIPYPVDRQNYDHSISFLRDILAEAKGSEKEKALRRLASVS
jgi:hypothetical protein